MHKNFTPCKDTNYTRPRSNNSPTNIYHSQKEDDLARHLNPLIIKL